MRVAEADQETRTLEVEASQCFWYWLTPPRESEERRPEILAFRCQKTAARREDAP